MAKVKHLNKRRNLIQRMHNRLAPQTFDCKRDKDLCVIDTTLNALYNNGDKTTKEFQKEILRNNRIKLTQEEVDRMWDILLSTGLVNPLIGFGNSGKLAITNQGYQLMRQYGSYSAFIKDREKKIQQASQQSQEMLFPRFIIEQVDPGEENNEDNG
jgi:hypothetical protein